MDNDTLRANEQNLLNELKQFVDSVFESSIPGKSEFRLEESEDGFRYVFGLIKVPPQLLEDAANLCKKQFSVLEESPDFQLVKLECSIPNPPWVASHFPTGYRRIFRLQILASEEIEPEETTVRFPLKKDDTGISLLLSGGGFRASLFHLGVLRYLRETNQLNLVREVFSISGGSITAAHLAKRWDDYNGTENQFHAAATDLVSFTQKGIRDEILRRYFLVWLVPFLFALMTISYMVYFLDYSVMSIGTSICLFSLIPLSFFALEFVFRPVKSLQHFYRELFGELTTESIVADRDFYFLATNLTTGNISCYTNNAIYPDIEECKDLSNQQKITTGSAKLAECVAASSAFPPLFSPVPLDLAKYGADARDAAVHYLTDGGVFDNLGIRAFRMMSKVSGRLLVSDAERRFDWSVGQQFRWLMSRATRATDVLMHRVNFLENELIDNESHRDRQIQFARLQEDFNDGTSPNQISLDLKRRIRRIRTDLDSFNEVEIQSLFAAGYVAAKHAGTGKTNLGDGVIVGKSGLPTAAEESKGRWLPIPALVDRTKEQVEEILEKSKDTVVFRKELFLCRNWSSIGLILTLLFAIVLNPLSLGLMRNLVALKPSSFSAKRIFSISDEGIPDAYSLKFIDLAMDTPPPVDTKNDYYIVESDSIGALTLLHFRPREFSLDLKLPEGCRVFNQKAFLYFNRSSTFRIIEPIPAHATQGSEKFCVKQPTDDCQVLILVGVVFDEPDPVPLKDTDFVFVVGDCNETEN